MNKREVLEQIKTMVNEQIKHCDNYRKELFKEMQTARARKFKMIERLQDASYKNTEIENKYKQALEILESIEF